MWEEDALPPTSFSARSTSTTITRQNKGTLPKHRMSSQVQHHKANMTTKLHRIKSALRESIEIASKATDGPWTLWEGDPSCVKLGGTGYLAHATPTAATFLAHARTMTPLACKALLTAIEGLELIHEQSPLGEYSAWDTLESITSEWPDV